MTHSKNVRRTFLDLFSDIASPRSVIKRRKKRCQMSGWLGVLPLQSEAQLADHGLVVRPLPVVDDQPTGVAGEQAVAQGELTATTTNGITTLTRSSQNPEHDGTESHMTTTNVLPPHCQARPPIVDDEIVFLAEAGWEGDVGPELSLSALLAPLPGQIIGDSVEPHLRPGRIRCTLAGQGRE